MDNSRAMIAISAILMIGAISVTGVWVSNKEEKPPGKPATAQQIQHAAGHRYLQKCGDDVTVEYRSLRKLPKGAVCGE
jgi:hypothetical protein